MSIFTDEFAWSHRLNTNWSLDRNLNAALRSNLFAQKDLHKTVSSLFQQASQSQMATSTALGVELAHQAERFGELANTFADASYQNSESVVTAIQQMSDYLGGGLCEVRWALERHSQVSVQILRILLESLDNMSRQYFEQGIKWYEKGEHELAKDRFLKALEANLTNYFAYQYLGFIAVAQNDSEQAIRNFDLAQKIADDGYHRALALSHLARSYQATGDLERAATLARGATESDPDNPKFWYEFAAYSARLEHTQESIAALKKAIQKDWNYFTIAAVDNDFDLVRVDVDALLGHLREQQKGKARKALDDLKRAIETAGNVGVGNELSESKRHFSVLEERYARNNLYEYNSILPEAAEWHELVFNLAQQYLDETISNLQDTIKQNETVKRERHKELNNMVEDLRRKQRCIESDWKPWEAGCFTYGVLWFVVALSSMAIAMEMCPDICESKILIVAFGFLFPFFIPFLINRLSHLTAVTSPSHKLDEEIREMELKVAPLKKQADDQQESAKAKIDSELHKLEAWREQCKRRQNIPANSSTFS